MNPSIILFILLVASALFWMGFEFGKSKAKKKTQKTSGGSGGGGGVEMNQGAPQK